MITKALLMSLYEKYSLRSCKYFFASIISFKTQDRSRAISGQRFRKRIPVRNDFNVQLFQRGKTHGVTFLICGIFALGVDMKETGG